MPRIDPYELLKCLSVLLSPEGGINSREEVPRLVNLMTKFSKKLVSKCVYLLILKSTDVTLVDMFMTSGGWLLIHTWLQEAMANSNWNFVQEVLELLLITPVDSTRLRLNNIPKLVKTLSKREDLGDVKEMATSLVNNWLAIVKNSTPAIQEEKMSKSPEAPNEIMVQEEKKEQPSVESPVVTNEIETIELPEPPTVEEPVKMEVEDENTTSTSMFYKITVRDGKQVLTKLVTSEDADEKQLVEESETTEEAIEKKELAPKIEDDIKKESKSKSGSNSKSSSGSNRKSSSSKSSSSSKDKHSSKHSSKSSSSSRDKDRKRDKENEKDKHRSNGSAKHTSSSSGKSSSSKSKDKKDSKETKEKQAEKDKDTLEKLKPVTLDKIGRIPKKTSEEKDKEVKKKPSMSIEPKKKAEDRPKTVKIFNSKMRSTGLEEEAKPPPPRSAVKKPPAVIPPINLPTKRPSPPRDHLSVPPEKKIKLDIPERIGAIKLIPPKPKPAFLQESDIFMDALTAASSKKEPKKKKRRLSQSKEPEETVSPVQQPSTSPPIGIKNCTPANFYQETLDTTNDNDETKEDQTDEPMEEDKNVESTTETTSEEKDNKTNSENTSEVCEPTTRTNSDGLKGALVYFKKKGPKRSLRWKDDKDLVDIRYFELDETERVNVSRPNFTELAKLDMTHEREALLGRKLNNEDLMEPTTVWRVPYLVDQPELPVQPGSKSLEKDIQYARSKNTLQALYFNKNSIPDTPGEPIPEIHPMVDPVTIPLEDAESQICDLRNTPWPEPKGMAPVEQPPVMPPMFPNMPGPFPNFPQMGPQGFPGMQGPRFGPPNMIPNGPPNMMPNNMNMMGNPNMNMGPPMDMINQGPMNPGPMNQGPMNQGPMNPNMFGPNGPNMDGYNPMMNENQNFPMPFNQPNMYGPPNNNFNNMDRGGGHRGRGAFRRGHNNWNRNVQRGGNSWRGNGDHRGGRICKNVKNHGYCRKMDTCPFIHPN